MYSRLGVSVTVYITLSKPVMRSKGFQMYDRIDLDLNDANGKLESQSTLNLTFVKAI